MPRTIPISSSEVEELCSLIEPMTFLYDPEHLHYRDARKTKTAWDEIAEAMGISYIDGDSWKKKWRNLRDTYVKKKKEMKKEGSDKAIIKWSYYDMMDNILRNVITTVTNETIDESQLDIKQEQESEQEDEIVYDMDIESRVTASTSSTPQSLKRASLSQVLEPIIKRKRAKTPEDCPEKKVPKRNLNNVSQSAEDAFFDSCKLRMKRLSKDMQSLLTLQIAQLFYNAENPHLPQQEITPLPVLNQYEAKLFTT